MKVIVESVAKSYFFDTEYLQGVYSEEDGHLDEFVFMGEMAKVNYYVEDLHSLVASDKEAAQGAYFSEL